MDPAEEARETVRHVDLAAETALWTRQAPGLSATKGFVNQPSTWLWRTQGQCGPARHVGPARRVLLWTRHARGSSAHRASVDAPGAWVWRTQGLRGPRQARGSGADNTFVGSLDTWVRRTQWMRQTRGSGTHEASVDPPTTWKQGPPKARQARRYGPARRTIEPARIVVPAVSGGKEANWQAAVAPGGENCWKHLNTSIRQAVGPVACWILNKFTNLPK